MKKLRLIAKWTIQTILLVYIVIIVLLHLPAVQRVVGTSVAKAISAKLGTKVRIERVDLGFLNRIVIDNIVIYDQHNHQMLSTARLAAQVDIIPLIKTGSVFISLEIEVSKKIRSSETPALPSSTYSGVGSAECPGQNEAKGHMVRSPGRCPAHHPFPLETRSANVVSILVYRGASLLPIYKQQFR